MLAELATHSSVWHGIAGSGSSIDLSNISIEWLDYCVALRLLGVLLSDGRCAVLQAPDAGLVPVDRIEFAHWVCGPG